MKEDERNKRKRELHDEAQRVQMERLIKERKEHEEHTRLVSRNMLLGVLSRDFKKKFTKKISCPTLK